ncbi:uncharacterized protein LOC124168457 [Ischnura elegans]|uniref:uncharacterized protein LOC124168457 n=1 Tax=Ischnura elegans TaxID=197161 RepID=UPI001ED8B138|nr:uncharacterized protein LOC124168457 [Ischnura elegans]
MLEYMSEHHELAFNKLVGPHGSQRKEKLWQELSLKLNSCPSGATKDVGKWVKCWQDWKCDVKQKAAKIRRHSLGTGGGPPLPVTPLSNLEERLLGLIGEVAVTGVEGVMDPIELEVVIDEDVFNISAGSNETFVPPPLINSDEETCVPTPPPRKRCRLEKDDASSLEERSVAASEKMADAMATMAREIPQLMRDILQE